MITTKVPVILDTDIGLDIDDTWALGLLLKCPELDVKLITTTTGNTLIKTKIVAKFLENAGFYDIPIGIGRPNSSYKGPQAPWVKTYDLSQYPGNIYENCKEVLCSTIIESSDPITIIGTGPLGNIAEALEFNQKIAQNGRFVGVCGSIHIGYEGKPEQVAEYNIMGNIKACKEVFQAEWEKTITPLDTCGNIVLSGKSFEQFMNTNNPIVNSIKENYEIWADSPSIRRLMPSNTKENRSSILFDTVAIYLAFSEELLNIQSLKIEVTDNGLTKISDNGNKIRCATSWKDVQAFKDLIVNRLIN
ncbi:MAG: nucleoside hydrolase [Candidatus Thorarchaeota archaeon]